MLQERVKQISRRAARPASRLNKNWAFIRPHSGKVALMSQNVPLFHEEKNLQQDDSVH